MTATATLNRSFSLTESSAIASIDLQNLPMVDIVYQSNIAKVYTFQSTPDFSDLLVDLISTEDLEGQSVGRMISLARSGGELKEVQV
jgi:hypothetical protein